ncbi:hypothetical protein EV360DRAFT_82246 [Lentinula raphanica]|nr:hypothetical protein EV360DRAFT_82246 [Lentinula raphanica]
MSMKMSEVSKDAQDLVREIIRNSFAVTSLEQISNLEPVSAKTLELFRADPEQGPTLSDPKLDTSGTTLLQLKSSSWNQALIYKIAQQAESVIENTSSGGTKVERNELDKLVADRLYRILRKIYDHKTSDVLDVRSFTKRSRSLRVWKLTRRQRIAAMEQQSCRQKGDLEGYECWSFILNAVTTFQTDGMSDEEDGEEDGEKVKLVLDVGFRRSEFRSLFRSVDNRDIAKGQGGRRLRRRVEVLKPVERLAPRNIPPFFLNPGFRGQNNALPQDTDKLEADLVKTIDLFQNRYNMIL